MSPLGIVDPRTAQTLPRSPEDFYRRVQNDARPFADELQRAQAPGMQAPSMPAPSMPAPVATTGELPNQLLVKPGDTLSEIALQIRRATNSALPLGAIMERLAQDNNVKSRDLIYQGVTLDLRGAIEAAQSRARASSPAQQPAPQTPAQLPPQTQPAQQGGPLTVSPATNPLAVLTAMAAIASPNPSAGNSQDNQSQVYQQKNASPRSGQPVHLPPPTVTIIPGTEGSQPALPGFKPLPESVREGLRNRAQQVQVSPQQMAEQNELMRQFEESLIQNARVLRDSRAQAADLPAAASRAQHSNGPASWPEPVGRAQSPVAPMAVSPGASANAFKPQDRVTQGQPNVTSDFFGTMSKPSETVDIPMAGPRPVAAVQPPPVVPFAAVGATQAKTGQFGHSYLLQNPGGDAYAVKDGVVQYKPGNDEPSFMSRVGKDISDAGHNLRRVGQDLYMGSTSTSISPTGQVIEKERRGLLGSFLDFGKDLTTGITLGAVNLSGDEAPEGVGRLGFGLKKVFVDGVGRNLMLGVPKAALHTAEDAAMAGLNTFEVIPDATIGNISIGKKATSAVFDSTQVAMNGSADLLGGESWDRVGGMIATGRDKVLGGFRALRGGDPASPQVASAAAPQTEQPVAAPQTSG